jgi:hypothetical protein
VNYVLKVTPVTFAKVASLVLSFELMASFELVKQCSVGVAVVGECGAAVDGAVVVVAVVVAELQWFERSGIK